MYDATLLQTLESCGARFASDESRAAEVRDVSVRDFGDVAAELAAARQAAVVIPLWEFCRLRISGRDRAKFLHNFCTNDVKGLPSGRVCEAFFTDVKARILAHGFVLAADAYHEIRMLTRSPDALRNHLERYIITEDVVVEASAGTQQTFVIAGPDAATIIGLQEANPLTWSIFEHAGDATVLSAEWDGTPVCFLSVDGEHSVAAWQRLTGAGARPAGMRVFDSLRIRERFPVIGRDLSSDNLAPEAGRDATAVCYTKGCYLGQEPIARIDAMGHVNRRLTALQIGEPNVPGGEGAIAVVTSESVDETGDRIGLAVVRLAAVVGGALTVSVCEDVFTATVR